jgi:hypothetical protein
MLDPDRLGCLTTVTKKKKVVIDLREREEIGQPRKLK